MLSHFKYCKECKGWCCKENEMLLSKKDIRRILKNNNEITQKEDFVFINQEGYFQLKNIDYRCVFFNLKTQKCEIYDYRPKGCRFYPLIYDIQDDACIVDKECPYWKIFYEEGAIIRNSCKKLKIFIKNDLMV